MAELNIKRIITEVRDHLNRLGVFEALAPSHEPKNAPGQGPRVALWFAEQNPAPAASGLDSSGAIVVINIRLYQNMLAEPQDDIDPEMVEALDAVMRVLHADFTLGDTVRNIDVFGAHGIRLRSQAEYLQQDGRLYRVIDITVPLIVNDLWDQAA